MVKECLDDKRDWAEVEFQVSADDLSVSGYSPGKTTFRPNTPLRVVFIDASYTHNVTDGINSTTTSSGESFGTIKGLDGSLELWIGYPFFLGNDRRWETVPTSRLKVGLLRLSWKSQGQRLTTQERLEYMEGNTEIFRILIENWTAALKVYPESPMK